MGKGNAYREKQARAAFARNVALMQDNIPVRGCDGKLRHPTKDEAMRVMARTRRSGNRANGPRLNVYECERCGCWHVGHHPTGGRQRD